MKSIIVYTDEEGNLVRAEATDDDGLLDCIMTGVPSDNDEAIGWMLGIMEWGDSWIWSE